MNPIKAFEQAWGLTSLTLQSCEDFSYYSIQFGSQWQALKTLEIQYSESSDLLLAILRHRNLLGRLKISVMKDALSARQSRITLPHLRTLQLRIGSLCYHLIDDMTLPSLLDIYLCVSRGPFYSFSVPASWPYESDFLSLLERSKCPIQNLSLVNDRHAYIPEDFLLNCLASLPELQELWLVDSFAFSLGEKALHRLAKSNGEKHTIIPELRILKIYWLPGKFFDEPFAAMVESRLASGVFS